jgi:hypothetical protein
VILITSEAPISFVVISWLGQFVFRSCPGFRMFPGFVTAPEPRFRVCLCAICFPRTIRVPRPIQSFRVLLWWHAHSPLSRGPADRPHSRCLASAQTVLRSYYSNMDPTYSDRPAASIGRSPRSDAGHPVPDQADFSGQPLDLPTNPASMEAGLRQLSSFLRHVLASKEATCNA